MKTIKILPKRVFNSPLIEYMNLNNEGAHINLIKIAKPYANGDSYAIHETTKNEFCSNGLFKTYEKAKEKFDLMVILSQAPDILKSSECVVNIMRKGLEKYSDGQNIDFKNIAGHCIEQNNILSQKVNRP